MHRCGSAFLLTSAIILVAAFTGCLGKSSSNQGNGGVQTVTLNPSGMSSIDVGRTQLFTASGRDAHGNTVLGIDIQFVVASGVQNAAAPLSLITNGSGSASACAGTWDPTGAICSPGTPGIAFVTAVINGVSSPPATVYVHQHVDSIQIVTAETQPPQYDCFSQEQTWLFQGVAYSNDVDITNTVGPMEWSSSNAGVVTPIPFVPPNQPNVLNQVQTTARDPGVTQLFAAVSGTTSSPYRYTTCLIKAIYLQIGGQGQAGNSITVSSNGGSVSVTATAVDTLYGIANTTPLASPPLTWSTTNPEVAAFSSLTNRTGMNSATARANLGGATLTASCTPPTCNIGVLPGLPIYASDGTLPNGTKGFGTISVDVTSTSAVPTYTGWAATTGCNGQSGCSSALFSVTPGTTPIGSIVNLPRTPNSMQFNHLAAQRVYLGSDQGLMYVDVTSGNPTVVQVSNSSTPCNVSLCGKVLTISNDGKLVVVSDTVSTPGHVYIYDAGSTSTAPADVILGNPAFPNEIATAAAFSPDQLKLFIATQWHEAGGPFMGNVYVYSTVDAFTLIPPVPPSTASTFMTPANAVTPSMDGSFAYVAVQPVPAVPPAPPVVPGFISGFANCDTPASSVLTSISIASPLIANPLALYPLPTPQLDNKGNLTEVVLALDTPIPVDPTKPPFTTVDMFGVNVEQNPLPLDQFVCNPPTVKLDPNFPQTSVNLGQGNFTPIYSQLVADGTAVVIVARHLPAVLLFNVSNGTTMSVPLGRPGFGDTDPLSAASSTDGSQVYIAACDQYAQDGTTCTAGSVHIVNTCGALFCNIPPAIGQRDFQQVPYANINDNNNPNMCNSQGGTAPLCLPNLIAIRPQ